MALVVFSQLPRSPIGQKFQILLEDFFLFVVSRFLFLEEPSMHKVWAHETLSTMINLKSAIMFLG